MQIRLVISDLDGTLLDSTGRISPRTRESIARARELGVVVTFATGRHWDSAKGIAYELSLSEGVICNNGAMIIDPKDGIPVYRDYLPVHVTRKAIEVWREEGLDYVAFIHDDLGEIIYYDRSPQHRAAVGFVQGSKLISRVEDCTRESRLVSSPKILAVGSLEDTRRVGERLTRELEAEAEVVIYGATPPRDDYGAIEVFAKDCTKASAAKYLAKALGIETEAVMALGDDVNDLELLEYAGLAVAVANSIPEVKSAADHITGTNGEDGFAAALERFVLGNEG